MPFDRQQLSELLLFYETGQLSVKEEQTVAAALRESVELREEYAVIVRLRADYQLLEKASGPPGKDLFSRIERNLQDHPTQAPAASSRSPGWAIGAAVRRLFASPGLAWGVVAAQCAILAILFFTLPGPARVVTLSSSSGQQDGAYINLMFRENTSELEIRTLVRSVGGEIVGGPSETGLYLLHIQTEQALPEVLNTLQHAPSVRFAEKRM